MSASYLVSPATPAQLVRAAAENHRQWMTREARAAGGALYRKNGAAWAYSPGGPEAEAGEVMLLFPRLTRAMAGETLDEVMEFCRTHQPLRHVACWSLEPPQPRDLGARLVARGFEWGWQPHWMALDLERLRVDHPVPPDLRIEPVEDEGRWNVEDLPYYYRTGAARMQALRQARPQRVWHFAAWLDGRVVGQSVMFLSTGRLGVAGIYSCGVVPAMRGQGIGTAVTGAACRQARAVGCRWALLNATGMGEPVYRRLGFESLGYGQTWWLHRHVLEAPPPTPMQIALAEAVGRGDIAALEALAPRLSPVELDAPLPAGMTPMELAVTTRQPRSAQWLERQGATLDVLSAWDLGWKERVPELLARSPELVNRRSGGWGATPLHTAAERGDTELARVLLAAHPDLEIQDTQFHSTPLGWARHLKRVEIVALIEQYQQGSGGAEG